MHYRLRVCLCALVGASCTARAQEVLPFPPTPSASTPGLTMQDSIHKELVTPSRLQPAAPDIKEKLLKGVDLNGRTNKNHLDGQNMLDYLSGKTEESPRKEFIYCNDIGEIVAARVGDRKVVYMENRAEALPLWREPFVELRAPLLFNLRRDPLEKAQHNANTYNDWWLDHDYLITPATDVVAKFLITFKNFPPIQTAGSFNLTKMQKQIEEMSKAGGK